MAIRFCNTLFFIYILLFLLATPAQARSQFAGAYPEVIAASASGCVDPWRPCAQSAALPGRAARPVRSAENRWPTLRSTAAAVATASQFNFFGKKASCGGSDDLALLKLDFNRFRLDMDIDTDPEDRFDAIRVAYRSCWY